MTLSEWLTKNQIADTAFADRIGVSRQALHRYKNGRRPEWSVLERIVRETEGAVTPNDFIEIPQPAPNEPPAADVPRPTPAEPERAA